MAAGGIGEASAIIAIAQLGFSLAESLHAYVVDVQEGKNEIASLANEIHATSVHIKTIHQYILENEITKGWNEDGLFLAKKCVHDCEFLISKLRKLLDKAGGGALERHELVKTTDVQRSNLRKLSWPIFKPQLVSSKAELAKIKIDVLIAVNTYQANITTEAAARKAAVTKVVKLLRERAVAKRNLAVVVRRGTMPGVRSTRAESRRRDSYYYVRSRRGSYSGPSRRNTAAQDAGNVPDDDYDFKIRRERSPPRRSRSRERRQTRRTVPTAQSASDLLGGIKTKTDAFEKGLDFGGKLHEHVSEKDQKKEVTEKTELAKNDNAGHGDVVSPKSGSNLKQVHQSLNSGAVRLQVPGVSKTNFNLKDGPTAIRSLKQLHRFQKTHPAATKKLMEALAAMEGGKTSTIPSALHDPNAPDGLASLTTIRYMRASPTEFTEIRSEYPLPLLMQRIKEEEKKQKKIGSIHSLGSGGELLALPEACRKLIVDALARDETSKYFWRVIVIDGLYQKPRSLLSLGRQELKTKGKPEDLVSADVVFKRCRKTRDSAWLEDLVEIGKAALKKTAQAVKENRERSKSPESRSRSRDRYGDNDSRSSSRSRSRSASRAPPRYRPRGNRYYDDDEYVDDRYTANNRQRSRSRGREPRDDSPDSYVYRRRGTDRYDDLAGPGFVEDPDEEEDTGNEIDETLTDEELGKQVMQRYTGAFTARRVADVESESEEKVDEKQGPIDVDAE